MRAASSMQTPPLPTRGNDTASGQTPKETPVERTKRLLLQPFATFYASSYAGTATFVAGIVGLTALSLTTGLWLQSLFVLPLLWLCVGTCALHREIHQEKKKIIEGMLHLDKARWLPAQRGLTPGVQWMAHLSLLLAIVLFLRLCAGIWGTALFNPAPSTLAAWGWYGLDLFCKAALFDIPEVFQINLIQIKHVGFFGGAVVLAVRMLILALLVSAVMRWRELYQLVERSASMAQHSPALSRQRLKLILQLYPEQAKRLCKWAHKDKWLDKPESRCAMLESMGEHKTTAATEVLQTLEEGFASRHQEPIRSSALRGLASFGRGPLAQLEQLVEETPSAASVELREEVCNTLAAWGTHESLEVLNRVALRHDVDALRLAAIRALGHSGVATAARFLTDVMYDGKHTKEVRFAAKDALIELGLLPTDIREEIRHHLLHSPYPDNRRFSGMILQEYQDADSFDALTKRLHKEEDPHALVYVIQGLAKAANRIYDENADNGVELVQKVVAFSDTCAKAGVFSRLKSLARSEESHIVARMASIQAMADFAGIWSARGTDGPETPSVSTLLGFLDELLSHSDPQIVDVTRDTRSRFPADVLRMAEAEQRRFHVNQLKAVRPAMPQEMVIPHLSHHGSAQPIRRSLDELLSRLHNEAVWETPHEHVIYELVNFTNRIFDEHVGSDLALFNELMPLHETFVEQKLFSRLQEIIATPTYADGLRFAAVHALADFATIWCLPDRQHPEAPRAERLREVLRELSLSSEYALAQAAQVAFSRLPEIVAASFEEEGRRDILTCADAIRLGEWKAKPLSSNAMRSQPIAWSELYAHYDYEDDCYSNDDWAALRDLDMREEVISDMIPPILLDLYDDEEDDDDFDIILPREQYAFFDGIDVGEPYREEETTCMSLSYYMGEGEELAQSKPAKFLSPLQSQSAEAQEVPIPPPPRLPPMLDLFRGYSLGLRDGGDFRSIEPHDILWSTQPFWLRTRFRLEAVISSGSLARVYKVYDRVECVTKALKMAALPTPTVKGAVLREIDALDACAAPGVMPLLDVYRHLDTPAFTVPWCEQMTLFKAMHQRGRAKEPWAPEEVEGILVSLCHILQHMHERGWCHGDIKPENVFYANGQITLFDLGASREIQGQPKDTLTMTVGTPYYMAPEQVHRRAIDKRVDIYALGILGYELLAGSLPLGMSPPPLSEMRDDLAPALDEVFLRATAYRAEERFATPEAFRLALLSALYPTPNETPSANADV